MPSTTHADAGLLGRIDRELAALERRADELRTARRVLAELLGELSSNGTADAPARTPPKDERPVSEKGDTASAVRGVRLDFRKTELSIPDAAKQVLDAVGRPMKSREIAERLVEAGYPTSTDDLNNMRNNVAGTLDRKIRQYGDTDVEKVGPGTYGLTKWRQGQDHTNAAGEAKPPRPEEGQFLLQ